jgi:hypothetical protein
LKGGCRLLVLDDDKAGHGANTTIARGIIVLVHVTFQKINIGKPLFEVTEVQATTDPTPGCREIYDSECRNLYTWVGGLEPYELLVLNL